MTISSTLRKAGPFAGNNVATAFPFAFKVFETSDVQLILVDPNGNETTLVLDSDYSIVLNVDQNSAPGGTITYPKTGAALATNYRLIALGDLPNDQPTLITNSGGFYPDVIMNMVDRATIQIQQLAETVSRSIVVTPADTSTPTLPPGAERANTILGFDASGNLELLPITASVGAGDMRVDTFISDILPNPTGLPTFTAGVSTQVVLSRAPGSVFNAWFFFDAGYQGPDQITSIVGKITTFTGVIPVGVQRVYAITGTTLSIYSPSAGSVIDASVAAGSKLYNRSNDELSVMDFGADPTGLNDSLTAFNAAAVTSSTLGKTVYVPGGVWKLSAQPTIGTAAFRVAPNASFTGVWPYFFRGFYTNINVAPFGNGANVHRFNDRSMFGTATKYDGKNTPTATDWINTLFPDGSGVPAFGYMLTNATVGMGAPLGQLALTAYGRTSDSGAAGNGVITFGSVVVNDNTVGAGSTSWNHYSTHVKGVGATGPSFLGHEIDMTNLGAEVDIFPSAMFPNGLTANLWLAAGGELPNQSTVRTYNKVSAAIGIFANQPGAYPNCAFEKGIVFGKGGVTSQVAVALPENYSITWFNDSSAVTNAVFSSATLSDAPHIQKIQFSDAGLLVTDGVGNPQFRVANGVTTGVNYLMAQAAASGQPASLSAQGLDADIVLALTPKGLGTLQFGTYTAGVLTGTGYVTIRDNGGTIRRVLIG